MKAVSKGNFNTKVDWKRQEMQTISESNSVSEWKTMRPYPQLK